MVPSRRIAENGQPIPGRARTTAGIQGNTPYLPGSNIAGVSVCRSTGAKYARTRRVIGTIAARSDHVLIAIHLGKEEHREKGPPFQPDRLPFAGERFIPRAVASRHCA